MFLTVLDVYSLTIVTDGLKTDLYPGGVWPDCEEVRLPAINRVVCVWNPSASSLIPERESLFLRNNVM